MLLVPAGAFVARGSVRARALALAVVAQILAYVPFYFDGNYPAGGARFFCDALPAEHVLAAVAVATFAVRRRAPERWAAGGVALALAGFAIRAGFDHAALRDRDGGGPYFEPAELARAGVTSGLVFLDDDHGFNTAFDPEPKAGIDVVRFRGDGLDRLAWEARGRPPAFHYRLNVPPGGRLRVVVEPLSFAPVQSGDPLVIEGESLWPAVAQQGAWALPEWAAGTCASANRWLGVHRADVTVPASIGLLLPSRGIEGRSISPRLAVKGGIHGTVELAGQRVTFAAAEGAPLACLDLPPIIVPDAGEPVELILHLDPGGNGEAAVDALRVLGREND